MLETEMRRNVIAYRIEKSRKSLEEAYNIQISKTSIDYNLQTTYCNTPRVRRNF